MDALAFATLGFAGDGTATAGGTTAVVLADVEIDGPVDVAAIDLTVDAVYEPGMDAQAVDQAAGLEVTAQAAASPEIDVEIDVWP